MPWLDSIQARLFLIEFDSVAGAKFVILS